jgi:hypothetical protein
MRCHDPFDPSQARVGARIGAQCNVAFHVGSVQGAGTTDDSVGHVRNRPLDGLHDLQSNGELCPVRTGEPADADADAREDQSLSCGIEGTLFGIGVFVRWFLIFVMS